MSSASMTPTTDQLKDLLDNVTPGEWQLCAHLYHENENGCTCGYRGVVFGRGDYAICQPGHEITPGEEGLEPPRLPRHEEIANMRLVALAPTLAAEVVRLRLHLSRMLMAQDGVPINAIEFGRWVDEARQALDATIAK